MISAREVGDDGDGARIEVIVGAGAWEWASAMYHRNIQNKFVTVADQKMAVPKFYKVLISTDVMSSLCVVADIKLFSHMM